MPKFVPVTDPERALAEQNPQDAQFAAHRLFDDPHTVKPVDRGWAQGQDGWGVLKKFGGEGRDDGAQVLRHGEGSSKMVRNDKGLWVRSKETESEINRNSNRGIGRGNRGVPVLGMDGDVSRHDKDQSLNKDSRQFYDEFDYKSKKDLHHADKSDHKQFDDRDSREYLHKKSGLSMEDEKDRERARDDSRERHNKSSYRSGDRQYRGKDRRDDYHRDSYRSRDSNSGQTRSRSHCRSESRKRTKDKRYSRDDRYKRSLSSSSSFSSSSTSSSRSRSRDNHRYKKDSDRKSRNRNNSRRRDSKHRPHSHSRERHSKSNTDYKERNISRESPSNKWTANETSTAPHKSNEKQALSGKEAENSMPLVENINGNSMDVDKQEEDEEREIMRITAVQVINRFHEVYSAENSKTRLVDLRELFAPNVIIESLSPDITQPYFTDRNAVLVAFLKTYPTPTSVSKRIYVELPISLRNKYFASNSTGEEEITFACDFHRRGTMPALGDGHKGHILLYQVQASTIVHIWGMEDNENLSERETLSFDEIQRSASGHIWSLIRDTVLSHAPVYPLVLRNETVRSSDSFETLFCHYHNYDQMEVWGLM